MNQLKPYRVHIIIGVLLLSLFLGTSYNAASERTVVTTVFGNRSVQFKPGLYWAGIGSSKQVWPNRLTVSFSKAEPADDLDDDNTIEMGRDSIMFGVDASTAKVKAIVQYDLPTDEATMLEIDVKHRSPVGLVNKCLAPYTKACLKSSGQLMSAETHYSGGRSQMIYEFIDQLKYGQYLLLAKDTVVYDSLDNVTTRRQQYRKTTNPKTGLTMRLESDIAEYGIRVGGGTITDTEYSRVVLERLERKQKASTDASVSKQTLLTAQQQQLTAKAVGEKRLTEIEYQQKQEQTRLVVAAETQVKLAEQDLIKQEIALKASAKEALKIKQLADAEAYAKQRIMAADGALDKKLKTYTDVMTKGFEAIGNYSGAWVPSIIYGNSANTNGAMNMIETLHLKTLRDLSLDMKAK